MKMSQKYYSFANFFLSHHKTCLTIKTVLSFTNLVKQWVEFIRSTPMVQVPVPLMYTVIRKKTGGGWTVFQKRLDGSVDFYRGWNDYKKGFGNLNGEFWLGLVKINRLTSSDRYKLRVDLEDTEGKTAYAEYNLFAITGEWADYQLSLGSYSGWIWTINWQ